MVPTILSTGKFLKTMVIFRGLVKAPQGPFPKDLVACGTPKGTMNTQLMMEEYLPKVNIKIFRSKL